MNNEHASSHGTGPGHEGSDIHIAPILKLGAGLAVLTVAAMALMAVMFRFMAATEPPPARPAASVEAEPQLPPEPRLQVQPARDLQQQRAAEDEALQGYGWVDRDKDIVRIPIERAMELLAERGLPSRQER